MKKRRIIIFMAGFLIMLLIVQIISLYPPKFYLNLSPSVPMGLYRLQSKSLKQNLKIGDFVIIKVPRQARPYIYGRHWLPQKWRLIKNVGALPGDKFEITDKALFINNTYIGPVYLIDHEGKPLPKLRGAFLVPSKYFLPVGTGTKKSFDGRYFGPVPQNLILGKAMPVVTWR
jgi:conjugative transfer signal peptidase TraF